MGLFDLLEVAYYICICPTYSISTVLLYYTVCRNYLIIVRSDIVSLTRCITFQAFYAAFQKFCSDYLTIFDLISGVSSVLVVYTVCENIS